MPPPPAVSDVAEQHVADQQELQAEALALLARALQRSGGAEAWRDAVAEIGEQLLQLQVAAAASADGYLDAVLAAQAASAAAEATVNPEAFADLTDGGGSWLRALVFAPNSVRGGQDYRGRFEFVASSIVLTGLQDTGRAAVQTSMLTRPAVTGYVRMLTPPSCPRCAVLAGRVYGSATPFNRHPRCNCRHIPAAEDADDWTTSPEAYFRSLSPAEQDRAFTQAGARAIREGADVSQVVNARQGMAVVNAYGRDVQATLEGTTKRGIAGKRLAEEGYAKTKGLKSSRYAYARTPRLMPEEIFQLADELGWDRAETLRQLRRFAYVL